MGGLAGLGERFYRRDGPRILYNSQRFFELPFSRVSAVNVVGWYESAANYKAKGRV